VQVHVRKDRRDDPTLRHSGVRVVDTPVFHHASFQPLADETHQHPIAHPLVKHFSELALVDRPEEVFDVRLQDMAVSEIHRLFPHGLQRIVRRPPGTEAVRAVQKVLLVHCPQHHGDRPLKHFVFKARNPDRPGLATVAFRDMHPSHGWRAIVVARLCSIQQRLEVLLQIRRVLARGLAIHSRCSILARPPISLVEPFGIDMMRQRAQRRVGHLLRQCRYPLKFR